MLLKDKLINEGYSLVCDNGYCSKDSGIKPIMSKLEEDLNFFSGSVVADKIIGKAAAMLFVLSGVKEVYALVLSKAGKKILEDYNIIFHYDELTDKIINRKGDDICPMEKTVQDIDDLDMAYEALRHKVFKQ